MGPLKSDRDLLRPGRRYQQHPHISAGSSGSGTFLANFNQTKCGATFVMAVLIALLWMHNRVAEESHYVANTKGASISRLSDGYLSFPPRGILHPSYASDSRISSVYQANDDDKINSGTENTPNLHENTLGVPQSVPPDGAHGEAHPPQDWNKGNNGVYMEEQGAREFHEVLERGQEIVRGPGTGRYGDMRIAVLVPYSGPGLPVWFDAFVDLAARNSELVDWIIFCEKELAQVKTPSNVKMIPTSPQQLAWLLAGIVYPPNADQSPEIYLDHFEEALAAKLTATQDRIVNARLLAARFIQKLLSKNPYYMVEFKPALGWVFRKYLKDYTHWAYGDLDVFFGDLTQGWLEPAEMRDYDIVTYSFGDQHRAYLRGQLTVHKSIPQVNDVWRHCSHLNDYMYRIEKTRMTKRYTLESAEGCYSAALMFSRDVRAKYAVRVFTDMPGGGLAGKEVDVVITGDALVKRCPAVQQRRGEVGGALASLPRMQEDYGPFVPVHPSPEGTHCEYWISDRYQTCLDLVMDKEGSNVYLINGQYYQRELRNLWEDVVEEGCKMGAFHHFQEFKINYRSWNTRPPMPPMHLGMVAGEGGLVPLPSGDWREMAVDPRTPPPNNRDRFTHRYCMQWAVNLDKEKGAFACEVSVTAKDALRTLHDTRTDDAKLGGLTGGAAVTLGGVGTMDELDGLLHSLREWTGPKILVLVISRGDVSKLSAALREESNLEVSCGMENALVVAFVVPDGMSSDTVQIPLWEEAPRKSLLNALHDLCQTRHLLTLSPGFRIGRGTEEIVSKALQRHVDEPRVLVIPQYCVDTLPPSEAVPSLDLDDMRALHESGTAGLCHKRDIPGERGNENVWLGGSTMESVFEKMTHNNAGLRGSDGYRGSDGFKAEETSVSLMRSLLRSDVVAPVLVVDLWSAPALFLRHVEEFTRTRCYEGTYARGLWAAGFEFKLLPTALSFAMSPDVAPNSGGCRTGVEILTTAYSLFLKHVRQVYSKKSGAINLDEFRLMSRGTQLGQESEHTRRKRHSRSKPFGTKKAMQDGRGWTDKRRGENGAQLGEGASRDVRGRDEPIADGSIEYDPPNERHDR